MRAAAWPVARLMPFPEASRHGAAPASVAPATPDKKNYLLPITVLVPADTLTFVPQGDKESARAEFRNLGHSPE